MSQTILVVDDESSWRTLCRQMLEAHGYRVETATGGDEALAMAWTRPPALIILDHMMPGMSGIETCGLLRRNPRSQSVPIIMLTVRGETSEKLAAFEAGADDYITKPCDFDELLARVRAHLRQASRLPGPPTGRALRLEGARRQLLVEERALPLTRREYDLLDVLIRNANRLVSRETIARDVWGGACGPDANVIEVYIRRLRHKLRDAGYAGQIRTMWGVGYMLESPDAPSGD